MLVFLPVQAYNDAPARWRCPECNSKATIATKVNNGRFPAELAELSAEERVAFWRDTPNKAGDVKTAVEHVIQRYGKEEEYFEEGGAYLPLSVWERQGWDVERIKSGSRPTDVRETAQGGICYCAARKKR